MLAPLTISELQNRFYLEKCPYWWVYEDNAKRKQVSRFRDDEPNVTDEERLDYAWMQLEELLNGFPYGRVEVVLKSAPSSAHDKSTNIKVEWGVFPQRVGRTRMSGGGVANSGAGNWQMMQFFIAEQNKVTQQLHQSNLEAQELRFQNQLLEQALEQDNTPNIHEKLLEEGIGAVKMLLTRPSAPPVHVGTLGQRSTEDTSSEKEPPASDASVRSLSIDASMPYVKAITDLFPKYSRVDTLKAFHAMAVSNKELIASQLEQYINGQG